MAFELSPDFEDGEIAFQLTEVGSDFVIQMPIGFDAVEERVFSIFVTLSPEAGSPPGEYELAFCLIDIDEKSGEELTRIWDGQHARRIISDPSHRALVLDAILVFIHFYIEQLSPARVIMLTHSPNLPDKALRKFNRIATLFRQNGYRSGQCDPYHGRRIWIMEKV